MKKTALTFFLACIVLVQAKAQDSAKAGIESVLQSKHYIFEPTNMTSSKGRMRHLTPGYFIKLNGDSLSVYLPYVGRAYSAPMGSSETGYDFTTTDFTYEVAPGKKKSYNVSIKTKGKMYNSEFSLSVYDDGTTYVRAVSTDRDAVSYNGNIQEKK